MIRQYLPLWAWTLILIVIVSLFFLSNVVYTTYAINHSQDVWCTVLRDLTHSRPAPGAGKRSLQIYNDLLQLRRSYSCG